MLKALWGLCASRVDHEWSPPFGQPINHLCACLVQLHEVEVERDELLAKIEEYDAYVQVTAFDRCLRLRSKPAPLCLCALMHMQISNVNGCAQGVRDYEVEVRANMDAMEAERARFAPGSIPLHASLQCCQFAKTCILVLCSRNV